MKKIKPRIPHCSMLGMRRKLLLTMKLSVFLFFISLLTSVAGNSYSQTQMFSMDFSNSTVREVLQEIENSSSFKFMYSENVIDVDRKVSLNIDNKNVNYILNDIFSNTDVEYTVKDRMIILSNKKEQQNENVTLVNSQQATLTGKIVDVSGEPLPGVTIMIKGTTNGTITDFDGNYSIANVPENATIQFSFVGMKSQEVAYTGQANINVTLEEETIGLEEVVAVGYGVVRKSDLTGSVASIKSDDIKAEGSGNIQKALQGKTSGVSIQAASGSPGSGMRILIRGTGSLNNNEPLYIVDGVQVENINNILPSDIESMEVLKDASAGAIYGSRASNGVVLVTTKSGKKGEIKIDINANYGVQKLANKLDVLNAREWAQIEYDAAMATPGAEVYPIFQDPSQYGKGTDWQDELYTAAPMYNMDVSASGGTENLTVSVSGGYLKQDGIVRNTDYDRTNFRIKSDFKKGRLTIGESAILSRENWQNSGSLGGRGGGPSGSALKHVPVFDVYDDNAIGGFSGHTAELLDIGNPVAMTELFDPEVHSTNLTINLYAQLNLADGLDYKYNVGSTNNFRYNYNYTYPYAIGTQFTNLDADLSETRSESTMLLQEHTLNYLKEFNKSRIQALIGYTFQTNKFRNLSGGKSGMPEGIYVLDAGSAMTTSGGSTNKSSLESFLGRLIYSYDDRYLVTATFRRDGSSRFSKNNRYGNFPSIALGWTVSNEDFFSSWAETVNQLKVRASYGILGNQEIGNYLYSAAIQQSNYATANGLWVGGTSTNFASTDIKWEKSKTMDIGVDLGFFSNKLTATMDYFVKRSSDLLLQVPLPLSAGSASDPMVNAGDITNKGFEGNLVYRNKIGKVNYEINGTFTAVKNKVESLGLGSQQIFGGNPAYGAASSTLTQEGGDVGAFYLIKTDGIFNSMEEVQAHAKDGNLIQPYAQPGDVRFVDYNNDGTINESDRQLCGSPTPKFEYGFGFRFDYKGFDAYLFFQGTYGNKIFNGIKLDMENMVLNQNHSTSVLNAWTETNHSDIPRLVKTDYNENNRTSDRYLESGSYLRFKTLQLGYTLTGANPLLNKAGISSFRIFASADNLLTFTKYSGYNPDLGRSGSILSRGVDLGSVAYPLSRTVTLGVQVSF